jgi:uncharacterized protein YtpQ (UPF0354 family)
MSKRSDRDKKKKQEKTRKSRQKKKEKILRSQARLTPRGEYTLFEHPQGVFQVEFPTAWDFGIEDDGQSVQFAPKGRSNVALSCYILPYAIDIEAIVEDPKLVRVCEEMFKKVNAQNPRRDATIRHFAMKADRYQEPVAGHYWFVAACDIFLGLSTFYPEDEEHLWTPVFERMLSTFRIVRENEALFNRVVTRLLIKLQDKYPEEGYKLEGHEIRGKDRAIPLGNLFARVKNAPEDWEQLADEFFQSCVSVLYSTLGREPLDDVRDEIFPFIRSDSFGPEESRLARNEWLADLSVAYVIRIPSGFRYITEVDLERWNIELEDLHQLAITNLCRLETAAAMPQFGDESPRFAIVVAGDNMEASRMLNPRLYDLFADKLGGPFIAAIPCRDALVVFPNDRELRRHVQQIVRKDYETSAYPISDRLFLVTPDGTTLAEW